MLYRVQPGQWIQRLCGIRTNWHREQWSLRGGSAADVMKALAKCEEITEQPCRSKLPQFRKAEFHIHQVSESRFVCFFYTCKRQWLDCCEIDLERAPGGDTNELFAKAFSFSAAVVPASSPLAIIPSILLFWIPFSDMVCGTKMRIGTLPCSTNCCPRLTTGEPLRPCPAFMVAPGTERAAPARAAASAEDGGNRGGAGGESAVLRKRQDLAAALIV